MRITTEDVMLRFAELLSERATCSRARVGAVVTDASMLQVLGIGYNGNARGLANACDDPSAAGSCGCLHAELNALLKAPGVVPGKVLFTTTMPCAACAKAAINSNIVRVFFRRAYRDLGGVTLLLAAGVEVTRLDADGSAWPYFFEAPHA
jgi:deoxycytidylate deaminase